MLWLLPIAVLQVVSRPDPVPVTKLTNLSVIRSHCVARNVAVIAEVDDRQIENLTERTKHTQSRQAMPGEIAHILKSDGAQNIGGVRVFPRKHTEIPHFALTTTFERDLTTAKSVSRLLNSLTPDQWTTLKRNEFNIPASLLNPDQRRMLLEMNGQRLPGDPVYELRFVTYLGVQSGDGINAMRRLHQTATYK